MLRPLLRQVTPRLARAVSTAPRAAAVTQHATTAGPPPPPPQPVEAKPPATFHVAGAQPIAVSSSGVTFRMADGREVLDGVSGGAAVACLGYSNPDLVAVMARQAAQMPYAYHQALGHDVSEELAQFLIDRSSGAFVAGAFLNSGSEAIEAILKLVRQYWIEEGQPQRKYIIARSPAYHGNTLGSLGTGYVPGRRNLYDNYFSDAYQHVDTPQARDRLPGENDAAYSERLAAELDAKIEELGPENVMAFIAEPVGGTGPGVTPPPKGYFPAIEKVVKKHNLIFIMDEVMSGTGRSGTLFAFDTVAEGVKPDVISMAKGLGGGYVTISGVLVGQRLVDVIRRAGVWKNSHTYQNHPVNCAVALAVLKKMEDKNLLANVRARGTQLLEGLKKAFKDDKRVFEVRGQGLFLAVDFDVPTSLTPRFAARVKERAMANGLMALAGVGTVDGVNGDCIILAPAYTITAAEADKMVAIIKKSVNECFAELE
ncbi:uncharacterized protein CcaverHIS019_0300800 [Cutaneotrichosporon cavernicola]|uniref:PLP-dependent transferase n=1 Tax=Cutaneotrichosporon cavernicola TaxID=279322 RepID=A0AA48I8Z5_9TREE|nr:uncharacterized protein CcaverHIS019_0300800 [Cutaneotrichosporon cavernicola]BEI90010.1 hypothetical protein CcaverHIS019_0300800 [Cutaneotrichosporon cavernicola]BEI97783.1 hypothetical protein CcaverHIS631_0300820 [Cutaneotrichosporon cavernicola]BEJ05561.1 hypothetical protein CcaverHIS641_0300830 [Cutaneotrichosporon cavernicola]